VAEKRGKDIAQLFKRPSTKHGEQSVLLFMKTKKKLKVLGNISHFGGTKRTKTLQ